MLVGKLRQGKHTQVQELKKSNLETKYFPKGYGNEKQVVQEK
jgi:hypothetical protein